METGNSETPHHDHQNALLITEAIILAGGLGTRLRSAVPDLPKCMAPVAGLPFVAYVIDHLRMQGIRHFVFSLGYRSEAIEDFLAAEYGHMSYTTVVETEPLGTGGGIALALTAAKTSHVLVANGDTLFKADVPTLVQVHRQRDAECTLALKPMQHFTRYGMVEIQGAGNVTAFREKGAYDEGLINGGVYVLDKNRFLARIEKGKFSFENDYLEAFVGEGKFFGVAQDRYFIDIGIPEDFEKAGEDLERPALSLEAIDATWTLFLDRDGVINEELPGTYVLNRSQFRFLPGVLAALPLLSARFGTVIVVSNQRGIGKGLMTTTDLNTIHEHMMHEIGNAGAAVDALFFSPDVDDRSFARKPNPGMALQALRQFPEIDFSRSLMIGNKPGDMRFARAAGMFTVFITSTDPAPAEPHPHIDMVFPSLAAFAEALQS